MSQYDSFVHNPSNLDTADDTGDLMRERLCLKALYRDYAGHAIDILNGDSSDDDTESCSSLESCDSDFSDRVSTNCSSSSDNFGFDEVSNNDAISNRELCDTNTTISPIHTLTHTSQSEDSMSPIHIQSCESQFKENSLNLQNITCNHGTIPCAINRSLHFTNEKNEDTQKPFIPQSCPSLFMPLKTCMS